MGYGVDYRATHQETQNLSNHINSEGNEMATKRKTKTKAAKKQPAQAMEITFHYIKSAQLRGSRAEGGDYEFRLCRNC